MFVVFERIFGCTGTRLRNFIFASRALAVCARVIFWAGLILASSSAVTAQTSRVSVSFNYGVLGEYSNNAHQPDRGRLFSTLGISRATISQNTNNGQFGGTQGNDYDVDITFFFTNGTSTTFAGAVNWRDTAGSNILGIGLIGAVAAPADGTGYVPATGLSTSYLFRFIGKTHTYPETASGVQVVSGNAATSGLLNSLNAYLNASIAAAPSGPVTVTAQKTNDTTPTITGTATLGTGDALQVTVNGVVYTTANGLTVTGTTWSLTLPTLADGTYSVEALIIGSTGYTKADSTSNELQIDTTGVVITGPNGSSGTTTGNASKSVNENTVTVATFTAPETVTWSVSGTDAAKFTISAGGVLTFITGPDYELPSDSGANNIYDLTVKAVDQFGNETTQIVTVTVLDVNPEPVVVGSVAGKVADRTGTAVAGATVKLINSSGAVVATTTSAADGTYSFASIATGTYSIEFITTSGRGAKGKSATGTVNGRFVQSITVDGAPITGVDAILIDPSGVVYNSTTRAPVAGAVVTLLFNNALVPNSQLDTTVGGANTQTVGADGLYTFVLNGTAPSGAYTLNVVPPSGYTFTSRAILPTASSYTPALGGGIEAIQAQATAPTGSQPTTYYLNFNFTITTDLATTSNGVTQNHLPIDPNPDTGQSTITASPTTVLADGTTTSTITVQLKDASGNNLTTGGAVVTLASSRNSTPGTDTISGVTDNGDGTYTFTVTSTVAGNSTYTGTVGGATITDTAAVAFTAVAASPITSTITASPTTVLADGTSTSTITVQLKDASGNNLTSSGGIVTLSSNLAGSTLSSVIDRGNGTYTATLTSIAAGPALITGTLAGVGMTDTETVTFDAGPVLTGPDGAGGTTTAAAFAISLPEGGTAVSQITSDVAVTTWALGGVDAAQFSIASDGTITFRAATDYENPSDTGGDNVYTITVSATDADGFTTTRTLTVTITDAALPGTPPTTGTDDDGDGVADTIESSSADRDGDGISDAQDYDPQGYFYCQADGAILAGGVVTVTGPGTVNMVKNGSATGEYQWYVDAAGTYTMAIDTSGMQYPLIGTASAGAITLAGRGNPIVIGHTQDAATGYLGDFNGAAYNAAAPTAYYTTFVIAEGDGNVFGNNIPMLGCNNSVTIAKTTDGREPSGTSGTGTTGRFSVTLGRVSNVPVTLTYTVAGSAAAGSDFTALSGSVTIPAGQLSAVIDVAVLADSEADSGETVILTLTSASGGAVVLGSAVSATLTLSDGLIATIEDRLETVLQDDFNQTIALQSRQFAAMASDALTRLRFAGPNIDCSNADDTDLDGNGDAGLGSIALTADYLRTQYSCATRTRRLDYGGLSFATFDGQGTQAMLNFGTAREVQNDTSIDGRFVGGYVSLNSVTGQDMGGQITGVGANAGLYGARKLDSGLYLDTYAAAAVGYHSYDLLFDSTINAQGDYSYIGVFAGAAVSGDIGYDNATLRPRAGLDLGYGAASRASVRAYDTAASETGFITLDPARGLRAYGEVGILFGEDAKTQTDGQTGAQTDGAATSLQVRRGFGMTPRVFCEDGFGARNAGCGYGFGIEFSETKPQDNVAWHMSMDVERIEDLTRGDVEITREREFWNGAGAWSTGIAAGADGGFSAAQSVKVTW